MGRYVGPKCRLCRREGTKLFLKGERCLSVKCPIEKKGAVPPGQHGSKRKRRTSNYGVQLREKQKAKRTYGILETQFRRYVKEAFKKQAKGEVLLQILESRLDNFLYRAGFTSSRATARQLVRQGHVLVDGKKVTIPSYGIKPDQVVSLSKKAAQMVMLKKALLEKKETPMWLQKKGLVGKMLRLPRRDEIPIDINDQLIVEYYSR